jgi:aspartyl aminopeptidase
VCLKIAQTLSKDFIKFVNKSPSPYHVVNNMTNMLEKNGFKEVKEIDSWNLEECGKYYTTRNNTSLIAFNLGKFDSSKMGFKLIGAHTDSPNLRLNPISKIKSD